MWESITEAELMTILAALRRYQLDDAPRDPPQYFEMFEPLDGEAIDSLCKRLNLAKQIRVY